MEASSVFDTIASSKCELGLDDEDVGKVEVSNSSNNKSPTHYFFQSIWQKEPAIFHCGEQPSISLNWNDIADMLHHCRHDEGTEPPLFYQNGTPITDPHNLYSNNPHAAYLDGCSIIINHADFHHEKIAELCKNLQQTFPHVYANAYLTPACSHAVKAHADDRDVLVIQVKGKKKWRVYKQVPIQYPHTNEQVGKNGRIVDDDSVLNGGLCFGNKEIVLEEGDVLYLPRGYVHEASCGESSPSFHLTCALATHDWCMSVLLSETIRQTLDSDSLDFRKALPIGPCDEYESTASNISLTQQLEQAMAIIQSKITALKLEQNLRAKYQIHNTQANEQRNKLIMANQSKKRKSNDNDIVGVDAASRLTLESSIRVSTSEERESVPIEEGRLRGLTVREETMSILMIMLTKLKSDPGRIVVVKDMRVDLVDTIDTLQKETELICDFTLLSFARCCVELGALAIGER